MASHLTPLDTFMRVRSIRSPRSAIVPDKLGGPGRSTGRRVLLPLSDPAGRQERPVHARVRSRLEPRPGGQDLRDPPANISARPASAIMPPIHGAIGFFSSVETRTEPRFTTSVRVV